MAAAVQNDPSGPPRTRGRAGHLWRTAGLVWVLVTLGGSAVGMFPAIIAPAAEGAGAVLPALGTLAVTQVAFVLGVYPLILARRGGRAGRAGWPARAGEAALWLVVAAPFAAVCGYVSDAASADVVRAELVTAAAFPVAWAFSALAGRGRVGTSAAVLAAALLVLGHPAALYLVQEFWPGGAPLWLWHAGPVLLAWTAASRQASWVPLPLWAWLWPPAAAVVVMVASRLAAARE